MKARRELHEKASSLIRAHSAFAGASADAVSLVLSGEGAILRDVAKAAPVLPCHSPKNAAAVLLSGKCHVCVDGKIADIKKQGDLLGLESLLKLDGEDRKIFAAEPCKVVYLKKDAVEQIKNSSPEARECFEHWLTAMAEDIENKNRARGSDNAEKVLAEYFLSKRQNEKGEIQLPENIQKIAKHLGIEKNSFFAALQALNAAGAVTLKGSAVSADREKLSKFIK